MEEKNFYDLIILGAGPAGMTAGVYAARKQLDTLVITSDIGGQATWSDGIENYLGYVYITGAELVKKFEEHLTKFDIKIEFTRVVRLVHDNGLFTVHTEDTREFTARSVIVATGKSPRMLDVPGEKEFVGRGVTYCATCDGPLFSGQHVAVVGGGNSGLEAALQLMKICPKVYLLELEDKLRGDEIVQNKIKGAQNVEILTRTTVTSIYGEQFVKGIFTRNLDTGETGQLDVTGVFVEIGLRPNTGFIKDLLTLNRWGEIPVDCASRTAIPGLYAAGDVTDVPEKQIIVAAGDGAKAALGAYSYLVRLPKATSDWSALVAS